MGVDEQQIAGMPVGDDQQVGQAIHHDQVCKRRVVVRVDQVKDDRRRHARLAVGGQLEGRITATRKRAHVVDISPSGALVEHLNIIPPDTISFVTFFSPDTKCVSSAGRFVQRLTAMRSGLAASEAGSIGRE